MLTINLVFILRKSVNYGVNLFSNRNVNSANAAIAYCYCCKSVFSGNIIIETKFFDGELQVSVSNVRVFYI